MKPVFVDTSFYIAFVNPRDALHSLAEEIARNNRQDMLTTEYVLVEVGNWLCDSGNRQVAVELIRRCLDDPRTLVIAGSRDVFLQGLELYAHRQDKDWSLTDCISIEVMQRNHIEDVFSADRHFEQAGFRLLMPFAAGS